MTVDIFVYTKGTHVPVWDSEGAIPRAVDITWDSTFHQGYGIATFKVRRKDVFAVWDVKEGMTVIIRDDGRDLFDGRIDSMPKSLSGNDEFVTITCVGWFIRLREILIRHRWVDRDPHELFYTDLSRISVIAQQDGYISKKDGFMRIQLATADIFRTTDDYVSAHYTQPSSPVHTGKTRKVTCTVDYRTGEGFDFIIYNEDTALVELSIGLTSEDPVFITVNHTFVTNPEKWHFRIKAAVEDLYDNNDYVTIRNILIYGAYQAGHPQLGSETYSQAEIIKDTILMVANDDSSLSTDFSEITDSDLPIILTPYTVNRFMAIADIIDEVLSYGNAVDDPTYRVQVWGRDKSSDSKPQVHVQRWDATDWDYEVSLSDSNIINVSLEAAAGNLINSAIVEFTDDIQEYTRYEFLEDTASISDDYRRIGIVTVGKGHAGGTIFVLGSRFLAYHKDRKTRGSIVIRGEIRRKGGDYVPVIWLRAGERIKIIDTGEIFVLNRVSISAENQEAVLTPDIDDDDNISRFLANVRRRDKENYGRRKTTPADIGRVR